MTKCPRICMTHDIMTRPGTRNISSFIYAYFLLACSGRHQHSLLFLQTTGETAVKVRHQQLECERVSRIHENGLRQTPLLLLSQWLLLIHLSRPVFENVFSPHPPSHPSARSTQFIPSMPQQPRLHWRRNPHYDDQVSLLRDELLRIRALRRYEEIDVQARIRSRLRLE